MSRFLDARKPGEIDIVQLQINYLDWESPSVQARLCYEAALAHEVGIIVMEPVKGGLLSNLTPEVLEVFKRADAKEADGNGVSTQASPSSWALRFVLGLEGVINVLSGMSNLEQMEDNIQTAENFKPLSAAELDMLQEVIAALEAVPTLPCTDCRYCVDDCPQKINTPQIIAALNEYTKYQNLRTSMRQYEFTTLGFPAGVNVSGKSSECTACGTCEEHCPQEIAIIEAHKQAAKLFEQES